MLMGGGIENFSAQPRRDLKKITLLFGDFQNWSGLRTLQQLTSLIFVCHSVTIIDSGIG